VRDMAHLRKRVRQSDPEPFTPVPRILRPAAVLPIAVAALLLAATSALAVTGQLTQLPGSAACVRYGATGTDGSCGQARQLNRPNAVAISPDAKNVYVVSEVGSIAVFRRDAGGALTQLPGEAGCITDYPRTVGCADGKVFARPNDVAVSADGKNVYVSSFEEDAVAVFRRNTATGTLTQLAGTAGCVSETGFGQVAGGRCTDGRALISPTSLAVSGDGKSVYVVSGSSDTLAVFRRNATTGELTQLPDKAACVRREGGDCRDARAFTTPIEAAVSADGKHVYVASAGSDAVAVLNRNTFTGGLFQDRSPAGCISETGTEPTDPETTCRDGKALARASSVVVSADDKNVYVSSRLGTLAAFRRDAATGALTQLAGTAGCVSETGADPADPAAVCTDGKALDGANSLATSADGRSVYLTTPGCSSPTPGCIEDAVAVFRRFLTNGGLSQLAGTAGCVSDTGSGGVCSDGKALNGPIDVAVSADGKSVYVVSHLNNAVAAFARQTPP
jgi:DNA-binding beta-propeller fold protein YncE